MMRILLSALIALAFGVAVATAGTLTVPTNWSTNELVDAIEAAIDGNAADIAGKQDADADLDDLADGSLTGSKVGTGISATNVTTGTLDAARLPASVVLESEIGSITIQGTAPSGACTTGDQIWNTGASPTDIWICPAGTWENATP